MKRKFSFSVYNNFIETFSFTSSNMTYSTRTSNENFPYGLNCGLMEKDGEEDP